MYQYQNNILSIPARLLYEEWGLLSYPNYKKLCYNGKLVKTKTAGGADTQAWVSVYDLPVHRGCDFKEICFKQLGDPKEVVVRNHLENYMLPDAKAAQFFANHRKPDGRSLSFEDQKEKMTNAIVMNAIRLMLADRSKHFKRGLKTQQIWENILEGVNALSPSKWPCTLPGNWRRLKAKYEEYLTSGYEVFIHKGEGLKNRQVIKGDIADFILASYALPNKPSVPEVSKSYHAVAYQREWPELSEQAIYNWLYQPEQERKWTIARDGAEVYRRKFANTIDRDRSQWFPNAYWCIDATKLDLVYLAEDSASKMEARLKIEPVFDVYSEKIIGYSIAETESHVQHIEAISMALNTAQSRPYLFTYDKQSGHQMKRMQELYDSVIARDGGTHYTHKVGQKSNPAEQLFARLQQQVISKFYFSDKQGVRTKRDSSHANPEHLARLVKDGNLPTRDKAIAAWQIAMNDWNNSEHPHFKAQTRNQVYEHSAPLSEPISVLEIAAAVWVKETKPVTYKRDGLTLRIGDNKYKFEVLNHDGSIDVDFRRVNVNRKFIVRYNPEYIGDYVQLLEQTHNGLALAAMAQPKRTHEQIPALMNEGDKMRFIADFKTQQLEMERDAAAIKAVQGRSGITVEQLIADQDLAIKLQSVLPKTVLRKTEGLVLDTMDF